MLGSTPSVAAVFFTLRDSYGLQHCRPVCSVCSDIRSESRFCLPHLHSMPPLGGFLTEYRHPIWHGKTRMAWLPNGEKISKISLFVLAQRTNVTDRRTVRHRMPAIAALMHSIAREKQHHCTEANCKKRIISLLNVLTTAAYISISNSTGLNFTLWKGLCTITHCQ